MLKTRKGETSTIRYPVSYFSFLSDVGSPERRYDTTWDHKGQWPAVMMEISWWCALGCGHEWNPRFPSLVLIWKSRHESRHPSCLVKPMARASRKQVMDENQTMKEDSLPGTDSVSKSLPPADQFSGLIWTFNGAKQIVKHGGAHC